MRVLFHILIPINTLVKVSGYMSKFTSIQTEYRIMTDFDNKKKSYPSIAYNYKVFILKTQIPINT